ncbi:hypothetical protein KJ632_05270 [Patescibacteria group bacterium]|nr:hypothetical protein [Patescibacteria group bacterium]
MNRFNTLIDYDLRVPHGLGSKDAEIERQAENIRKSLEELLGVIGGTDEPHPGGDSGCVG